MALRRNVCCPSEATGLAKAVLAWAEEGLGEADSILADVQSPFIPSRILVQAG